MTSIFMNGFWDNIRVSPSRVVGWITALLIGNAPACLWDSDTLAAEAKGGFDVITTSVGFFDIYPPTYYEMRLRRVSEEIESDLGNLALYDDAAVACDRLCRQDEAIGWITRKQEAMQLDRSRITGDLETHRYRALANLGTFHAHRWIRSARRNTDLSDLQEANLLITKALELNPSSHFGREKVQLVIIRWMITQHSPAAKTKSPPPVDFSRVNVEPIRALCGLIQLGEAWESIDVFIILASEMDHRHGSLQTLSLLRANELISTGKRPILATSPLPFRFHDEQTRLKVMQSLADAHPQTTRFFREARQLSESRRKKMWAFMEQRFLEGRHPDTDSTFWAGWVSPKMPDFPDDK